MIDPVLVFVAGIVTGLVIAKVFKLSTQSQRFQRVEPLGPATSWEYDCGITMTRCCYRDGVLQAIIPFEVIEITPQMRPWHTCKGWGDPKHLVVK